MSNVEIGHVIIPHMNAVKQTRFIPFSSTIKEQPEVIRVVRSCIDRSG
jgi:hypothetical protein